MLRQLLNRAIPEFEKQNNIQIALLQEPLIEMEAIRPSSSAYLSQQLVTYEKKETVIPKKALSDYTLEERKKHFETFVEKSASGEFKCLTEDERHFLNILLHCGACMRFDQGTSFVKSIISGERFVILLKLSF